MSCDFGIWSTNDINNKQAGEIYLRLCEGNSSEIPPNPAIDAFYNELTAKHPEIDDVPEDQIDNTEFCPWSVAFDRSPGHLIICCVWSKAEYVENLIRELATKHGLLMYDPQSEKVYLPKNAQQEKKAWWKF